MDTQIFYPITSHIGIKMVTHLSTTMTNIQMIAISVLTGIPGMDNSRILVNKIFVDGLSLAIS